MEATDIINSTVKFFEGKLWIERKHENRRTTLPADKTFPHVILADNATTHTKTTIAPYSSKTNAILFSRSVVAGLPRQRPAKCTS